MFGTDRTLLFNVQPWAGLGFGVPNFGENVDTINSALAGLVDEIGKAQLYIMLSNDAMRWKPPSRNTIERLAKLITRVQTVLGGRQQAYNELRLEGIHASPAVEIFTIHPCPFFTSDILRNRWLKEYNNYVMIALSNLMQHSDNQVPLTVTKELAEQVFQWFKTIRVLMATELLLIDSKTAAADDFVFTQAMFDAYDPMKVVTDFEAMDTPGNLRGLPTEDDVRPLFVGYPANVIKASLVQAPQAAGDRLAGEIPAAGTIATADGAAASSAAGAAGGTAAAPPVIAAPGV